MALPAFNQEGDLPPGVHQATLKEVIDRFRQGSVQRQIVTGRLIQIANLVQETGKIERFILFGSYITAKSEPNDVDIVLIFSDDFDVSTCSEEMRHLLDHGKATEAFGASVFWIRPSLLFLESLDDFIAGWQVKRDRTQRGIVEVFL